MNAPDSPRRQAWGRLIGGMLFRVLILALILYTVYHCVIAIEPRMTTAVVRRAEEQVVTEGMATIFRDETVVQTVGQGLLISYPLEDGAKVSATSTLATLYSTTLDLQTLMDVQRRLDVLDGAIIAGERAQRLYAYSSRTMTGAALPGVHADIRAHLLSIAKAVGQGEPYAHLTASNAELSLALHLYTSLTGEQSQGAVTPLQALRAERDALLSTVARSVREMTLYETVSSGAGPGGEEGLTDFSGYFYHAGSVDGYETVFLRQNLATMNIVDYDMLHTRQPVDYSVGGTLLGKTVGSYVWSITLPVAFETADALEIGQTYSVIFPQESDTTVRMTLDRIIRSVGDGRAVLVLSTDQMPEQFSYTRFQTARLVTSQMQGYRIPQTALHEDDGTYVYILRDGSVRRREVTVLYRGQGYVLLALPEAEAEGGLSLHDVVITSGKDLYDGKYID